MEGFINEWIPIFHTLMFVKVTKTPKKSFYPHGHVSQNIYDGGLTPEDQGQENPQLKVRPVWTWQEKWIQPTEQTNQLYPVAKNTQGT